MEVKQLFTNYMASEMAQRKLKQVITDKASAARFTTAIVSSVVNNPALAVCDFNTIFSAALIGESLKLSPSLQLGQMYLVPYADNKNNRTVAQFQMGYKGYIQLAMRSGQYRDIDVIEVREGEYKGLDKHTGKPIIEFIADADERDDADIVGYYARFELVNGFAKTMFWTKDKMEKHALRYSRGYQAKKGFTFWEKDFNAMAFKTLLRQLLSKWGILSIDLTTALERDMSVEGEDETPRYVDNEPAETEPKALPKGKNDEKPKEAKPAKEKAKPPKADAASEPPANTFDAKIVDVKTVNSKSGKPFLQITLADGRIFNCFDVNPEIKDGATVRIETIERTVNGKTYANIKSIKVLSAASDADADADPLPF
jgi:recombination protein RecT